MKLHSFRLRIALLSALLAGSALVGFGLIAWRLIYVAKVSRLDAKLENQVKRTARPRSPDWWPPFANALPRELGTETDTPILLLVLDANGKTIYSSYASTEQQNDTQAINDLNDANLEQILLSHFRNSALPPSDSSSNLEVNDGIPSERLPKPELLTQHTSNGSWRIGLVYTSRTEAAIAVSLEAIDQEMRLIRHIFLVAIPGTLLLVAGGAWGLSGSALHPIRKLTAAIQNVTVTGFDQHVSVGTTDIEFVELIQVFNQMLERLERSFKQASRFSGDAAHELKTPLAILQGELERTMQQVEPGSAVQQSLGELLDEVHRLSGIIRKLLLLSLADAGQMNVYPVEVNLSEILRVLIEDIELLAPHLKVQIDLSDELWVQGDRDLLTQVLQNLVSNAIKYNLPQGWLQVVGRVQDRQVQLTLVNSSKDIAAGDRDLIFERFYRGDPAHTRKVEGVGLGLSLSREIARAHHGDLTLNHTPSGQTAFTLTLPTQSARRLKSSYKVRKS